MSFLEEISKNIFDENNGAIDDITVIIPNKRAATYVQKALSERFKRPFFAPKLITIEEWIVENTEETIINSSELQFIFYNLLKSTNNLTENFDSFSKWAKTLLNDFDEIDRYIVEPQDIFKDLRHIKEIENWSFNDPDLSNGQESFLVFWNNLLFYYQHLDKYLHDNNLIYLGKAYKKFALDLPTKKIDQKHYYFIGFNAISKSEETIIRYLLKEKKATFLTEIDEFYFSNDEHEASHFFKTFIQKWGYKPNVTKHFNSIPKKISVIECAHASAQVSIAGNIVSNLSKSDILKNTAIVLADESLLIPMLQNIPDDCDQANVTMGYPLKYSHLKSLVDTIFELQFNFQKFKNSKLYYRTLLNTLDHTYISSLVKNKNDISDFENEMISHHHVFIDWSKVSNKFPELEPLKKSFTFWENPTTESFEAINSLTSVLFNLFGNNKNYELELEILYHFSKSIKKFEDLMQKYQIDMELKSFKKLFYQFWQNESLSFLGNPIDGLQIMGILETRVIDFKNIVFVGMNEGNLPQTNLPITYIPYDLRKHHGLPTEEDRQAIFANHFYRLLHRSENVFFTYNSGTDDKGLNEKSRYITQLESEIDTNFGHTISYSTYSPSTTHADVKKIQYESSEFIKQKLITYLEKGLSPSALNKLINCPLDFFYRYILKMEESNEMEENIESSTFGTKIHNVIERIFRDNFLNKKALDVDTFLKEKKNLRNYLLSEYTEPKEREKAFSISDMSVGQNKLSFEISIDFLEKFIDKQIEEIKKSTIQIHIEDLESTYETTIPVEIYGTEINVKLTGKIDRVDKIGNDIRIIDYKSGKCTFDKVSLSKQLLLKENGIIESDSKGYVRQLLMYAFLYQKNHNRLPSTAGIISMVNLNEWIQNVNAEKNEIINQELLDEFVSQLKSKIEQLFDVNYIFEHNKKSQHCEHCSS